MAYALLLGHLRASGARRCSIHPGHAPTITPRRTWSSSLQLPPSGRSSTSAKRRRGGRGLHRTPSTDGRADPVSRVDDLIKDYERFAQLPWPTNLAPAQRVWMAVYSPEEERRLRLHLPDFEVATKKAGHEWASIDISDEFERWMASHEYRDAYFANPQLMQPELVGFFDQLVEHVADASRSQDVETTRSSG